jgi:hypothetical protein
MTKKHFRTGVESSNTEAPEDPLHGARQSHFFLFLRSLKRLSRAPFSPEILLLFSLPSLA